MPMPIPAPRPDAMADTDPCYFPIFLDLRGATVLVVGGDGTAAAKAEALRRAGAMVTVVAATPGEEIATLAAAGAVTLKRRDFVPADLDGARLCIVTLDKVAAIESIVAEARRQGVLINAVDRPVLCEFIMPAVVERGPVRIAISTGGLAPALARELRLRIEAAVPTGYAHVARFCGGWRARVAARLTHPAARREFWNAVLEGSETAALLAGDELVAERLIANRLDTASSQV